MCAAASAGGRVASVVGRKWLTERLLAPTGEPFRLLDGSWFLPNAKRDPKAEYKECHIPDALFFDIDVCSDKNSRFDHMLPCAEQFAAYVGQELGICNKTHVVVYDNHDTFALFSAQRVWWTFRVFGHNRVSVLEGGLPTWKKEGGVVTSEAGTSPDPKTFQANFQSHLVKSFEDLEVNISSPSFGVVDARPAGRFQGVAPEPRQDIKPGRMPNAHNVPFMEVMDTETRTLLPPDVLKAKFAAAGVDLAKPTAATCGSGISACLLALAAHQCGFEDVAVYDGSWAEWYKRAKPQHLVDTDKLE